jgi:hypothetical protein
LEFLTLTYRWMHTNTFTRERKTANKKTNTATQLKMLFCVHSLYKN